MIKRNINLKKDVPIWKHMSKSLAKKVIKDYEKVLVKIQAAELCDIFKITEKEEMQHGICYYVNQKYFKTLKDIQILNKNRGIAYVCSTPSLGYAYTKREYIAMFKFRIEFLKKFTWK